MASQNLSTTGYGDAQRQGKLLVAAGEANSNAGLLKLQSRNASGTITTYNVWVSSDGRLRYATTEPSNQLTSGTDVVSTLPAGSVATADLADSAVTPLKSSAAMQEMPVTYRIEDLALGADISGRTIFRTTTTMSLNRGSAFASFREAVSIASGDTFSLGLGTTAAFNLFGRSWTSTIAAGTFTSIAVGSVSAISTSTNIRLDVTQSAGVNATNVDIVWIPQKRGSN